MSYISTNLNLLMTIAKKASSGLSRDFSEIEKLQTSIRGHAEFTKAAVERTVKILRNELQKGRPQYAVIAKGEKAPNAPHFLISGLDGEINFMHGIPYFAVNIAEIVDGNIISAVIYNPATSDMFFAEKGNGAFKEGYRNHERLRVSARKSCLRLLLRRPTVSHRQLLLFAILAVSVLIWLIWLPERWMVWFHSPMMPQTLPPEFCWLKKQVARSWQPGRKTFVMPI